MKKIFLVCLALVSVSGFARQYGVAGCGLGSLVFGQQKGFVQVFASTTNGTSYTNLFGISSGTSNCVPDSAQASIPQYIENNKVALANDISRGEGESLSNLSQLYGCAHNKQFNQTLKNNFGYIFKSNNAVEINQSIQETLKKDGKLASLCPSLS